MEGNAAAGSERGGYAISGQPCGANLWSDNTAHTVSAGEYLSCCKSGNVSVDQYLATTAICGRSLVIHPAMLAVRVFTSSKLLGVVI